MYVGAEDYVRHYELLSPLELRRIWCNHIKVPRLLATNTPQKVFAHVVRKVDLQGLAVTPRPLKTSQSQPRPKISF